MPHLRVMNKEKESNTQLIKSKAKRLWIECFGDNQDFVNFYFEKVFKAEECKLCFDEEGQKAVAHIHLPVYDIALAKGLEIKANYISGACTDKAFRKRGVMKELLRETLREAKEESDLSASFLIPASEDLAEYYSKHFGYEPLVYHQETNNLAEILELSEDVEIEETFKEVIPFLIYCEQAMKKSHLRHSQEQWEHIFAEYKLNPEVSKIQSFYSTEGELQAVVLYRIDADKKDVFIDGLYGCASAKEMLLGTIKLLYPLYQIKAYLCNTKKNRNTQTYIMWRALNFMPFLIVYAHRNRDVELSLVIEDELTEERKAYHIAGGEVQELDDLRGQVYSVRDFVRQFVLVEHIALLHE